MADKKEDFQSFQIGSLTPPRPAGGPPVASSPTPAPTAQSTSSPTDPEDRIFPNIEHLIESEEIEQLGQKMGETCQKLDDIVARRSGRAKEEAQKARQAYERTFDLIDHLMQVKQAIVDNERAHAEQ